MAPPTNVVSRCQCDPNCPNPPIEGTSPFCKEHANGKCERISPLSGELPYAPNQYNKFPGIKEAFNCFAYAFGLFMLPNKKGCTVNSCPISFHQPGYKSGHPSWSNSEKSGKRCPDLISRIFGDVSGNKSNKKNGLPDVSMCHFNTKCPEGMRKIAVIVDAKQDYHFLRLDNNHYWSHKPGATDVTNVDASGRLFNGDELLYVLAKDRIGRGQAIGGVVGTLMTNLAVENAIKGLGIGFERANVGDRYVLELLKQKGWIIGGEGSGHLLCLDQHSTGDGTIAALQVLAAMSQSKKSLSQLLDSVKIFPQILLNIKFKAGYDWKSDSALKSKISQVEGDLKGTGRVLIRASGTEPVLRIMVEAQDSNIAKSSAKSIAELVPIT